MSYKQRLTFLAAAAAVLIIGIGSWVVWQVGGGSESVRAGFTAEFLERPDGYRGLAEAYDLQFSHRPRQLDPGLMYKACAENAVDVICGFATDGRIAAYNLMTLRDDKRFFPPYEAAIVLRADLLQRHPELEAVMAGLSGKIDDQTMRRLNLEVDRSEDPRRPADVAADFLAEAGLVEADVDVPEKSGATVTVGGKDFTEQNILGEMLAQLIEGRTNLRVNRRLYLGGTQICFDNLRGGDLDMYVEYTGTALVSILAAEASSDPAAVRERVAAEFASRWDLIWLEPLGFNNTYTLTMRRDQAAEFGIETISDLAEHVKAERAKQADK